jgi:hypothetical protein
MLCTTGATNLRMFYLYILMLSNIGATKSHINIYIFLLIPEIAPLPFPNPHSGSKLWLPTEPSVLNI